MSRKDERIATLEARVSELELERVNHRAELRAVNARVSVYVTEEKATFAGMLVRATREMREPVLRAGFLEELEALVPGTVEALPKDERPDALRKRAAQ